LKGYLRLIFDRGFADADLQWSVDELYCQIMFTLASTANSDYQYNNFSSPITYNERWSLSASEDTFSYIASRISQIKKQFTAHYPCYIVWSSTQNASLSNQEFESSDSLHYTYQQSNITIDTTWAVKIEKDGTFSVCLKMRSKCGKVVIQLPLGYWQNSDQINPLEMHQEDIEKNIKIVIDIMRKMATR
jgi:hypothetical protein